MAGPLLASLPGGLSPDGYLDRRLRLLDGEHYSAAGLLPYRQKDGQLELLLPKEKPWNSFSQGYDPLSWNLFGGKRVPRQERSAETTAVRCFLEIVGQVDGAPDHEKLYGLMQKSFVVWYPMGKFALVIIQIPDGELEDFPDKYAAMKEQAGPDQEYRMLPMGIKKWSKQIPEIGWVPAGSILPESAKSDVSDLLGSMLQITGFREFLDGSVDPEKVLPDQPLAPLGAEEGKGQGKSNGGKDKGKGKWSPKGCGKGMDMKGGYCLGMKGGVGPMGFMTAKGMAPTMMCAGAKGMPVMSPMMYPSFPQPASAEMQRQMYGEQLYALVQPMSPNPRLAQKITGMLLELPQNELILNLTNQEELQRRVKEALEVLREDGVA